MIPAVADAHRSLAADPVIIAETGRAVRREPKRHRSLDGLRALAILLVLLFHSTGRFDPVEISNSYALRFFSTGWNGVILFFVLSGFLVGNLALKELHDTNRIQLLKFWSRRMFRTWPLYFFMLFVAYWRYDGPIEPPFWHYLTFTQNFFEPRFFMQTWSLAVEEQFYFFLPLGLVLIARLGKGGWFPALAVLGVGLTALFRAWFGPSNNIAAVMDALLVGVSIAYMRLHRPALLQPLISRANLTFFCGVLVVYAPFTFPEQSLARNVLGELGGAVGFGLMVTAAFGRTVLDRLLDSNLAFWIALVSYSVYLTHDGTIILVFRLSEALGLTGLVKLLFVELAGISASCLVGALLFWLVEKPFLILRERLSPREFRAA